MPNSAFVFESPKEPEEHKHRYPQLVFGISGCSKIRVEETDVNLDQLRGCAIPSQTYHHFFGHQENRNITINFTQTRLDDTIKRIFEQPRVFTIDLSMRKFIQFATLELPEYEGSSEIGHDAFSQNIVNIFKQLLTDRIFPENETPQRIDLEVIDRYLDNHMSEKICVEDLARKVHTSPSHFFTLFRQETGISPRQYLIKRRVEKARQLLETTRMSIVEISNETGFSSQSALNNTFKAQFGCTPGSIRKAEAVCL